MDPKQPNRGFINYKYVFKICEFALLQFFKKSRNLIPLNKKKNNY